MLKELKILGLNIKDDRKFIIHHALEHVMFSCHKLY